MNARSVRRLSAADVCADKFTFGYTSEAFPTTNSFSSNHREVIGEWFVAPASDTIDTIFWYNHQSIGAYDSTVFLQVHASNIGPTYGPGVRPGPFYPPCVGWGYWVNTNDSDEHVAAFIEDATDTTWISTNVEYSDHSRPPFGTELWGLGGYPVRIHPRSVNFTAMSDLATPLEVTAGDKFFISMRIGHEPNALGGHTTSEEPTTWGFWHDEAWNGDPEYPSRDWKFYEHPEGPSNCSGVRLTYVQKGWVARGGLSEDTLGVGAFNIWYVMSVNSNAPPMIDPDVGHTFLDLGPHPIEAWLSDCNTILKRLKCSFWVISCFWEILRY